MASRGSGEAAASWSSPPPWWGRSAGFAAGWGGSLNPPKASPPRCVAPPHPARGLADLPHQGGGEDQDRRSAADWPALGTSPPLHLGDRAAHRAEQQLHVLPHVALHAIRLVPQYRRRVERADQRHPAKV